MVCHAVTNYASKNIVIPSVCAEFEGCAIDVWHTRAAELYTGSNDTRVAERIAAQVSRLNVTDTLARRALTHYIHHANNLPIRMCNMSNVQRFNEYVAQHPEPDLSGDQIAIKKLALHTNTSWKEAAIDAVHRMIRAFRLAQVPLVLAAGTHLGWFRQCDVILYTTDVSRVEAGGTMT